MPHTKNRRLAAIAEPGPMAINLAPGKPLHGRADLDLLCGNCELVIACRISIEAIAETFNATNELNLVCAECGTYNNIPLR